MLVHYDWSRIFRNDNVNSLCGSCCCSFFIRCNDVKCSAAKNEWFESSSGYSHVPIGLIISLIIFFELIIVVGGWKYKPDLLSISSINIDQNTTNTHSIGNVLYTDYIHLFQLSGMILLVAMIGAIVLTFRKRPDIKRQSYIKQISREKADGVELVEVKNKQGVKIDN